MLYTLLGNVYFMWTNKYQPTIGDWYLAKIDGKKQILMWNDHNKFFADFAGKTYTFNQIDCWLDDSKASLNVD